MGGPRRVREVVRALASGLALVAMLSLPPLALMRFIGWPLPSHVSFGAIRDALDGATISDEVLVNALACACWIAWLLVLVSASAEIAAWFQGRVAARIPAAGFVQPLVRQLVISATVLFGSMRMSAAPGSPPPRPVAAPVMAVFETTARTPEAPSAAQQLPTYVVVPRDSLWRIAERHLGDGLRWHEIWDLNRGQLEADGRTMRDPNLIRPGWVLTLPADATGLDAGTPSPAPVLTTPSVPEPPLPPPTDPAPQATATAPMTTTTATSTTSSNGGSTSPDDDRDHVPIPLVLAGGTLMAAGAVKLLNDLRRRQLEDRRAGYGIPVPVGDAAKAERVLRSAADVEGADRLDVALRVLGAQLAGSPDSESRVDAVRVDGGAIEILLTRAVSAPAGPFEVIEGRAWTLPSDIALGDLAAIAATRGCLAPGLVCIGHRGEQQILIDLEAQDALVLDSDEDEARALLAHITLDAGTHRWADDVRLLTVPEAPTGAALDRVEVVRSITEAVQQASADAELSRAALADARHGSTWSGRLANSGDGWSPTIVLLTPEVEPTEAEDAIRQLAGSTGIGLVAWLPSERAQHHERRLVIRDKRATLLPLGLEFDPAGLPQAFAAATDELIEVALSDAPGDPLTASPDDIDLTDGAFPDEAPTLPIPEPETGKVLVRVMGRVEIEGGRVPIDRRRVKELVALIALHPRGLNEAQIKNALWLDQMPTTNAFNQAMSRARTSLGTDDTGDLYIPYVEDGLYKPGPSLVTDWHVLESAWERARRDPTAAHLAQLSAALAEVRGLPFEGTKGYEWAYEQGIPERISAVIDEARQLIAETRVAS